jgi:hypothetical protein
MISYIHDKELQGPYHQRRDVYLPDKSEVISDKYSNM